MVTLIPARPVDLNLKAGQTTHGSFKSNPARPKALTGA